MSLKGEGKGGQGWGLGQSIAELGERRAEVMEDKNKEDAEYDQMRKENKGKKHGQDKWGRKGTENKKWSGGGAFLCYSFLWDFLKQTSVENISRKNLKSD